jgi:signal peptidase I
MLAWLKKHVRLVLLVIGGLSLVPAYLHAYTLAGPSDIPTVLPGDKLIVNSAAYQLKLPYSNVTLFRTALPKRGDFVLLHVPNNPRLRFGFFKRIMGLPGETIEIRENRDDSEDSREFGPVSDDLLLGKVIATFATGLRAR